MSNDRHDSQDRNGRGIGDRKDTGQRRDTGRREMEQRLRAALRADAERARISPDAWSRIHRRLTSGTEPSARPRGRGFALGLAAVAVTVVSVTGFLAVPRLLATSPDEIGPAARDDARTTTTAGPSSPPQETAAPDAWVLAELSAAEGTDQAVSLVLAEAPGGGAFLVPRERWEASADATVGQRIGGPGRAERPSGVCELRLIQDEEQTVRVRLATGDGCTEPYVFRLEGDRLVPAEE